MERFLLLFLAIFSVAGQSWNYNQGGADWPQKYPDCTPNVTNLQSPINFDHITSTFLAAYYSFFPYYSVVENPQIVEANGTINVFGEYGSLIALEPRKASQLTLAANAYKIEFHAPAEHQINGSKSDLEVKIMHTNLDTMNPTLNGNLKATAGMAVSILFNATDDESGYNTFFDFLTGKSNSVDLTSLVPIDVSVTNTVYATIGSLTIPPCTYGYAYYIFSKGDKLSASQLQYFTDKWAGNATFAGGNGNNRNLQTVFSLNDLIREPPIFYTS